MAELITEVFCQACGGKDYNPIVTECASGVYPQQECRGCGLIRLEKLPPPEKPTAIDPFPGLETFSRLLQWMKTQLILKPEIRRLKPWLKGEGPVLDVGCGTGWGTAIWRDYGGLEVHGVEFQPAFADLATKRLGLKVLKGSFEELPFPDKTYQLIILRHVLEHFLDPVRVLTKIHRILKTGGYVLIIVPNGDGLGRRIFHRYWAWAPPSHIYTFAPNSLNKLVETTGFRQQWITHSLSPIMISASVNNWLQCHKRFRWSKLFNEESILLNILLFPISCLGKLLRRSEVITILARKNGGGPGSAQERSSK